MMQCMSIVHHLSLVPGALDDGQTYRVTFEQVEVPNPVLGLAATFLQPGMELPVEFFDGHPITVVFSDVAEARVVDTPPPALPLSSFAFTVAG